MSARATSPGRLEVALFGGSFDPPHVGHVLAIAYALSITGVERVLVVPVWAHAFDKSLTSFDDRMRMTELATGDLCRVEVLPVERELGSPSRTLHTIQHLERLHPEWQLRLLLGADTLAESDKWLAFDEIASRAPLIVLGRAGAAHPGAPPPVLPEVSSTRIRELLRSAPGARSADPELGRLVPAAVLRYIDEHDLYRPPIAAQRQ